MFQADPDAPQSTLLSTPPTLLCHNCREPFSAHHPLIAKHMRDDGAASWSVGFHLCPTAVFRA